MREQPNILFIVADDHQHNAINALGNINVHTPVLDALIESGTTFCETHIMGGMLAAVCVPSRACLHTGVNVFNATMCQEEEDYKGGLKIPADVTTLPQAMRNAGYQTYGIGKWHNDRESFQRGFCDGAKIFFGGMSDHNSVPVYDFDPAGIYSEENEYTESRFSTNLFTDEAVKFLRTYDKTDPFFLYVAYTSPHDPRTPPEDYSSMYNPDKIPLPKNFMEEHPFDNGEMNIRDENLASFPRVPDEIRKNIADYYGMISHMDAEIGRMLETLEAEGLSEKTIIVYTADHGLSIGQHGLLGKQNMYDHSIRIPLIMNGPGLQSAKIVTRLTQQIDVFPTLCDLTGIPVPNTVEGKSLLPLLRSKENILWNNVYSLYKNMQRMVKTDDGWKLIHYYRKEDSGEISLERRQLFNIKEDPWEIHDLSGRPESEEIFTKLEHELYKWQNIIKDPLLDNQRL